MPAVVATSAALPAPLPARLDEPAWLASGVKRGLDICLSLVLLVVASPVLVLAMLAVRLSSPGAALFAQRRIGRGCRVFRMYKLRTMVDGAEELEGELAAKRPGQTFFKLENDPRVTPVGVFLRKYSIDELPQLYNVLRGDMSLVGPRPLLIGDLDNYPRGEQLRRFSKFPGLTGLWQVSGRSSCSDEERIQLDLEYVDSWSLWLDLEILMRTIPVVLQARGAC